MGYCLINHCKDFYTICLIQMIVTKQTKYTYILKMSRNRVKIHNYGCFKPQITALTISRCKISKCEAVNA